MKRRKQKRDGRGQHGRKGGKGPGYDYWSPRPGSPVPGKKSKIHTHRLERRQARKEEAKP